MHALNNSHTVHPSSFIAMLENTKIVTGCLFYELYAHCLKRRNTFFFFLKDGEIFVPFSTK